MERLEDHAEVNVSADAIVLSFGFRLDQSLVFELEAKVAEVKVIGSAIKDGTIASAVRTDYEVGSELFKEKQKAPGFRVSKDEIQNFGKYPLWIIRRDSTSAILLTRQQLLGYCRCH